MKNLSVIFYILSVAVPIMAHAQMKGYLTNTADSEDLLRMVKDRIKDEMLSQSHDIAGVPQEGSSDGYRVRRFAQSASAAVQFIRTILAQQRYVRVNTVEFVTRGGKKQAKEDFDNLHPVNIEDRGDFKRGMYGPRSIELNLSRDKPILTVNSRTATRFQIKAIYDD